MKNDFALDRKSDFVEDPEGNSGDLLASVNSSNEKYPNFKVCHEDRVSSMEIGKEAPETDDDGVDARIRGNSTGDDRGIDMEMESKVFDVQSDQFEARDDISASQNGRFELLTGQNDHIASPADRHAEVDVVRTASQYKSLLSAFDDFVANEKSRACARTYGFEVGDMVWGKVKSHPWWPGHIFNEAFASPSVRYTGGEGHVLVAFFGDSSYGWFDPAELIPFGPNFYEKSLQTNSRTFLRAVEEAVDEANRRRGLGLVCKCRNPYNFRKTNVQGYFAVDVPDFEPGGVYSWNQISKARDSFQPSRMISFIKQLALDPLGGEERSIDFVNNTATSFAYRKAVFEEFDETYGEAFGLQPGHPSCDSIANLDQPVKETPRAPLSGPLVVAEALGGRKGVSKPMKIKDNFKKDKYLVKRRDEPSKSKNLQISLAPSLMVGSLEVGAEDYVLQKRAIAVPINLRDGDGARQEIKEELIGASPSATEGTPHSRQQEGEAASGSKPVEGAVISRSYPSLKKPGPSFLTNNNDQVQASPRVADSSSAVPKLSDGMNSLEGAKKEKVLKRPVGVLVSNNSVMGEKRKKKKKKELDLGPSPVNLQKDLSLRKIEPMVGKLASKENLQVADQNEVVDVCNLSVGSTGIELPQFLADLESLALDPFHGVERNCPTIVLKFFLCFRSLVYQKSLVLSPPPAPESESVNIHATYPTSDIAISENPPIGHTKIFTSSKPVKSFLRHDPALKVGRKRAPSDRQEEIAAKRLKKISDLKLLTAEKKVSLKFSETQKAEEKKPVISAPSRFKQDSVKKLEPSSKAVNPTMLIMKFPPETSLPSPAELKARFARFGPTDQSGLRVFWKSSTCRIIFIRKPDAQAAYKYAIGNNCLFGNANVRYQLREVEVSDSSKGLGDDNSIMASRINDLTPKPVAQPLSVVKLKPCLKKTIGDPDLGKASIGFGSSSKPNNPSVKFMLGGENSSNEEKLMIGNRNYMKYARFADGAEPSSTVALDDDINSKKFQPVFTPNTQTSKAPFGPNPNLHRSEMTPKYTRNHSTTGVDISQQMLTLLTRCNEIVTNLTGLLGYEPYHPL